MNNQAVYSNLNAVHALKVPERPALAPNVQLAGEAQDTGYTERQWLVQRNGQFIQLSELLYRVVELSNGERSIEDIARAMTESTEWEVSPENVRQLLKKIVPLGLVVDANEVQQAEGLPGINTRKEPDNVALRLKQRVIGPNIIDPIARVLQALYYPPVLIAVLAVAAIAHGWLYFQHGVGGIFTDLIYRPWGMPIILGLLILAGIFHEFGHAAALRYGGGKVRGMGVGMYFIYPVFYTDVTDGYRLGRWARVRTDLGGFYFYLIFTLGILGLYALTGQEFLLFAIVLLNVDILYQLIPFVRMDGYWFLADLTGIPDLISMIRPFAATFVPKSGIQAEKLPPMKRWVRNVFTSYILLIVPVLFSVMIFFLIRLPRILLQISDSILFQLRLLEMLRENANVPGLLLISINILLLSLVVFGIAYLLVRIGKGLGQGLWNWGRTSNRNMAYSLGMAALVFSLLGYFWSPTLPILFRSTPAGVNHYPVQEREHIEGEINYSQNPPVGGNHAPVWQNCGFYSQPIAPENAVHSMEHGAVWITYQPDLPEDQLNQVRKLVENKSYILVSPNPGQESPLVASAWEYQLSLDSADDSRLESFIYRYRLSDNAPESGETCSGGIGIPE